MKYYCGSLFVHLHVLRLWFHIGTINENIQMGLVDFEWRKSGFMLRVIEVMLAARMTRALTRVVMTPCASIDRAAGVILRIVIINHNPRLSGQLAPLFLRKQKKKRQQVDEFIHLSLGILFLPNSPQTNCFSSVTSWHWKIILCFSSSHC